MEDGLRDELSPELSLLWTGSPIMSYEVDLRSRFSQKDTLLCLVGGHLDYLCVYLWFLIFNPTRSLGKG